MIETILGILDFLVTGVGYFFAGLFIVVMIAVIFTVLTGDRILWEYEAEGHCDACENGKIDVELKRGKKKGISLEVKGKFKAEFIDKEILILLSGYKLASFDANTNNGSQLRLTKSLEIEEPKAGDTLSIRIGEEEIFSQKICAD